MSETANVLVNTLAEAGVRKIFGLVGTSTLDLVDAIGRHPDLDFVSARTEEAAAHMADGYARASGRLGVVVSHVGPGALRQLYGVGTAWKDSVPLLLLTGNEVLRHNDLHMREAYHVVDTLEVYRPVTKAAFQLREAADARSAIARAIWLATSGRPGPVLLDLPKNSIKANFEEQPERPLELNDTLPATRLAPDPTDVARIGQAIREAARPVLMLGGGIHWSGAADAATQLAETYNLPVVTTDGGRGAIAEDHPRCIGVLARQAGDSSARTLLSSADVVLAIGTPFSDVSTFEWTAWSDTADVFQIDISPDIGFKGVRDSHLVNSDALAFLTALDKDLAAHNFGHASSWEETRAEFVAGRAEHLKKSADDASGEGVNPWRLISELDEQLPRSAFFSVDSGMHSFFGKKLRVLEPRTYLRSAGFGAMGYSFPAVLGALESAPGRRGVAIMGDGCLAMCMSEFETAARRQANITVVVFNDSSFASQLHHQHRRLDGRVLGTRFLPTDFVAIAAAQGVAGVCLTETDQVHDALAQALKNDGPSVIDARINSGIAPPTWIEGSADERTR